jgi:hypothetical protein
MHGDCIVNNKGSYNRRESRATLVFMLGVLWDVMGIRGEMAPLFPPERMIADLIVPRVFLGGKLVLF